MTGIDPFSLILILTGLGFLMLAAEVCVPGMVIGALGMLSLVAAVGVGFSAYGLMTGTLMLVGIATVTLLGFMLWMMIFPSTPIGRRLMLAKQLESGGGPKTVEDGPLLGMEGEAITPLRPAGIARIGERRIDVVTESRFVEPGERVVVIAQRDLRVIVRPLAAGPTP